ncbi:MAG: regulatory protein RecX [Pseudohongiella sp.]|nr:MAG: regulatory protein RecX [Pseudohongiella sp.]
MDYLARREHSLFELNQKLTKKFPDVDEQLLADVLDALKSEGLQSDERFAESYVRYRKSRGFAYQHIRADLSSRRVCDSLIGKYLTLDDEQWQLTADQLIAKKLCNKESPSYGSKLHRKLTRFLQSRGFASAEIQKAMGKHLV